MKTIQRNIDVNAHIVNINCEISIEGGATRANISFDNLGFGVVTAVKFNAKGLNSFGDIVQIDGKDRFFIIIQDISVAKNTSSGNLGVILPNSDIRKLELEECQICYADGSVSSYAGANNWVFNVQQFEAEGYDKEELEAVRDIISPVAKCIPQNTDLGWLCCCERFNNHDTNVCSLCGAKKSDVFKITDAPSLEEILSQHENNKKKKDKEGKIQTAVGIIIAIAVAIFFGYNALMSGCTMYSSEEEMRTALQGTYTYYNESGEAMRQIVIKGDTAIYKWRNSLVRDLDSRITWDYKHGKIHTFEDLIITNQGYIKDGKDVYEKGGWMSASSSPSSSYSSNSNYESGSSVLKITLDSLYNDSVYTVCTGSVKNTGKKTYKFIEVKGSFMNKDGEVVDTDWTYAVGAEGLAPGESSTFRISVPQNLDIKRVSASLLDYD